MRSLRAQLLIGLPLGTIPVLVVAGVLLDAVIAKTLWGAFDAALAGRARDLTALAEESEDGLEFESPEPPARSARAGVPDEYYQLWRRDGSVLARSQAADGEDLEFISGEPETPVYRGVKLPDGRAGRAVGTTFVPRQEFESGAPTGDRARATLVVARPVDALLGTLARVRAALVGVGCGAVLASSGILAWVVRRRLRPVDRLSTSISAVAADDLAARIDAPDVPTELRPVVDRVNDLLARLEAAFRRERQFTGDVAHELRTPLAGIRAKIELALSRARPAEAYRAALRDCLEIHGQMQRLVEYLLKLARADAGQLEVRRAPVDVAELTRECWAPLEGRAAERGLHVAWRFDGPLMIETDAELLKLVVRNILENAVAYADANGRIEIAARRAGDALTHIVTNTGSRLAAGQAARVFDRFWRGESVDRSTDAERHCGLGLPLCKAVIEQLGGSIEAASAADGMFSVRFRLKHPHGRADEDGD
jgi:heavy metal sensor kinase